MVMAPCSKNGCAKKECSRHMPRHKKQTEENVLLYDPLTMNVQLRVNKGSQKIFILNEVHHVETYLRYLYGLLLSSLYS